jgi:hypothetical protein
MKLTELPGSPRSCYPRDSSGTWWEPGPILGSCASWLELTTNPDHNDMRRRAVSRDSRIGRHPGQRQYRTDRPYLTSEGFVGSKPTAPTFSNICRCVSAESRGIEQVGDISCLCGARTVRYVDAASENHMCSHRGSRRGLHDSHEHGESQGVQPRPRASRITGVAKEVQPEVPDLKLRADSGAIRLLAGCAAAHLRHVS